MKNIRPRVIVVLALCLASCAFSRTWNSSKNLEVFDAAWNTVDERFFDPGFRGVDWPGMRDRYRGEAQSAKSQEALSDVINQMLSHLDTSHTAHYTPDDPAYYLLFDVYGRNPYLNEARERLFNGGEVTFEGIGIFTLQKQQQTFVQDVVEGGPAAAAGLLVGDEIVDLDGRPFQPLESFRGKAGHQVKLRFRRKQGEAAKSIDVNVESINPKAMFIRAMLESARVIERDGKRIGYIHLWSSADTDYHDTLAEVLQGDVLRGVDALIMDMRGKIGGGGMSLLELLDPRGPQMSFSGRGFSSSTEPSFRNRTVWLMDEEVRSSAEILAYTIRKDNYGLIVGANTAGAVVGGSALLMPDDSLLYVAVADLRVDGQRLEGVGVAPDIEVHYPVPYSSGRDPQLQRAVEEALALARRIKS